MGASDGTVLGVTTLLDHGPDTQRFNLVLVGEGFTQTQQGAFEAGCQELVAHLQGHPDLAPVLAAVNVYRLAIASIGSGAADPAACGDGSPGSGASPATFLDATYCGDGELRRILLVNEELLADTLTAQTPRWHAALVIVNADKGGGAASGPVATVDLSEGWLATAVHELGHAAFDLGDEYDYLKGAEAHEPTQNQYEGEEPLHPNVTAERNRPLLKWGYQVAAHIPVPTLHNTDCTKVNGASNPLSGDDAGAVGLFEGAGYHHCGLHRPAFDCLMRASGFGTFCPVCREAVHDRLRLFLLPAPILQVLPPVLDFGTIALGSTAERTLTLVNAGPEPLTGLEIEIDSSQFFASDPPGTLPIGASAIVSVQLLPQMVEGSVAGTLRVRSNAPERNVPLGASICRGVPASQIRVNGSPTNPLDFGAVVQGLTMYRIFQILNYPGGTFDCGAELEVELPPLPAPFFYPEFPPGGVMLGDNSYRFIIPPPDPADNIRTQEVVVGFVAPLEDEGTVTAEVEVRTSAPGDFADWPLSLQATVVPPLPLEAVLVIDRSGSMGDPVAPGGRSRMEVARDAARLFANMLRENHRLGIVRYNQRSDNSEDVILPLTGDLGPDGSVPRNAAMAVLAGEGLAPQGSTAIGRGMLTGSDVLQAGETSSRVMVVLTDGRQNTGIDIETARGQIEGRSPRQRIFAVGLGLDQFQREVDQIATEGGGSAHVTGELTGTREFLLHKLYAQIVTDIGGGSLIRDPRLILRSGARRRTVITLCESDREVEFVIVFRPSAVHPKYMQVWLENPVGEMIEAGQAQPGMGLAFLAHGGHMLYRLRPRRGRPWAGP